MKRLIFVLVCLFSFVFSIPTSSLSFEATELYFTSQPKLAYAKEDLLVYADESLLKAKGLIKKNQDLTLQDFLYNAQGLPIFQLKNGGFILASQKQIAEDKILEKSAVKGTYYLKKGASFYASPPLSDTPQKATSYQPYQQVTVTERAVTRQGTYLRLMDGTWVSESFLSREDLRMVAVQELLTKKYKKANLSIYVKQIQTDQVAKVNADRRYYSASISKLPILYYTQRQLTIDLEKLATSYTYTNAVNNFQGAYKPEGSSVLPLTADQKDYKVEELLRAVAKESDNVASNILGYYVAESYGKNYERVIKTMAGATWDMTSRQASAQMAGQIMEALYYQDGQIMESLSQTAFDQERIAKNIPVKVAHKIGDAYDFKHDVALVYASSPFVLSIFTENSSYEEITAIADDIYAILK